MQMIYAALLSLLAVASAGPVIQKRESTHCGTTGDATLSDCQTLINDKSVWDAAFNTDNTCTFNNIGQDLLAYTAYNVACHEDCCVYYTSGTNNNDIGFIKSSEDIRLSAQSLLGCGNEEKNKINGLKNEDPIPLRGGWATCISNGDGCSDCFDDSDLDI